MPLLQVKIPSSGVAQVFVPQPFQTNPMVQVIVFQNNAAHAIRYGNDPSVSVTTPVAANGGTAGKGILLASGSPGGAGQQSPAIEYSSSLSDWWIAGVAGDVIDVMYI